jgi:hypothetical protein
MYARVRRQVPCARVVGRALASEACAAECGDVERAVKTCGCRGGRGREVRLRGSTAYAVVA